MSAKNTAEIFWSRVSISSKDDCWPWTMYIDKKGYGRTSFIGRSIKTHRLAWELHHDKFVSTGKMICHSCDNPRCCNPNHLFEGTALDNAIDREEKKRGKKYRQTHCARGHRFEDGSFAIYLGRRICRECKRINQQIYRKSLVTPQEAIEALER